MITVFCPRCGHENVNDNRYCGMCGTTLLEPGLGPIASRAARMQTRAVPMQPSDTPAGSPPFFQDEGPVTRDERPISGPSFLGLGSEDGSGAEYLFDDQQSPGHWRLYLALAVLAFTAALLWLQWGRGAIDAAYLTSLIHRIQSTTPPAKSDATSAANESATTPNPGSGNQQGATTSSSAASPAPDSSAGGTPPAATSKQSTPSERAQAHHPEETDLAPENGGTASGSNSNEGDKVASAKDADNADEDAVETPAKGAASVANVRSSKQESVASAPRNTGGEMLVATAQKYLYGQGVPKDCDRALSYLRQAADGESPKAKSQLGALYATGNCVPVDRPTAYRWFAQALRQDQNNQYLSHDLQMLWNQMSSEEKQRALRMSR
jgi:hypothetical protein